MRVCHLVHNFPPEFRGGTEAAVASLAAAQQRRGDDVLVVAGSERRVEGGALAREEVSGLAVVRVHRAPHENYSVDHRLPRVAEVVCREVADFAPDVVHLHHWLNLSGDLGARLAAAGTPVVATLHDYTLVCARLFLLRPDGASCADAFPLPSVRCVPCLLPEFAGEEAQVRHELAARTATGAAEAAAIALFVTPSEAAAGRWRRSGLVPPERLVVLPHTTPLAGRPPPSPRPRDDGRLLLVTWGHLAPAKGVLDLLAALRAADDERLSLLVLGEPVDAAFAERLLDAAEGLSVSFLGKYGPDDLPAVAAGADLAVFPSRAEETFGLVVAEARALGLPVVTSDRGALPEALGEAGFALPAGDVGAWASALSALADDPARLARHRAAARVALPDAAAHAEAMAALYTRARAAARASA